jgi:hypothetical protein
MKNGENGSLNPISLKTVSYIGIRLATYFEHIWSEVLRKFTSQSSFLPTERCGIYIAPLEENKDIASRGSFPIQEMSCGTAWILLGLPAMNQTCKESTKRVNPKRSNTLFLHSSDLSWLQENLDPKTGGLKRIIANHHLTVTNENPKKDKTDHQ